MKDLRALIEKCRKEYKLEKPTEFIEGHVINRALKHATGTDRVQTLGVDDEVVLEWILESEAETEEPKPLSNAVARTAAAPEKSKKDEKPAAEKKPEQDPEADYEEIFLFDPAEYERYIPKRGRK